jgi:hypothetical protein
MASDKPQVLERVLDQLGAAGFADAVNPALTARGVSADEFAGLFVGNDGVCQNVYASFSALSQALKLGKELASGTFGCVFAMHASDLVARINYHPVQRDDADSCVSVLEAVRAGRAVQTEVIDAVLLPVGVALFVGSGGPKSSEGPHARAHDVTVVTTFARGTDFLKAVCDASAPPVYAYCRGLIRAFNGLVSNGLAHTDVKMTNMIVPGAPAATLYSGGCVKFSDNDALVAGGPAGPWIQPMQHNHPMHWPPEVVRAARRGKNIQVTAECLAFQLGLMLFFTLGPERKLVPLDGCRQLFKGSSKRAVQREHADFARLHLYQKALLAPQDTVEVWAFGLLQPDAAERWTIEWVAWMLDVPPRELPVGAAGAVVGIEAQLPPCYIRDAYSAENRSMYAALRLAVAATPLSTNGLWSGIADAGGAVRLYYARSVVAAAAQMFDRALIGVTPV